MKKKKEKEKKGFVFSFFYCNLRVLFHFYVFASSSFSTVVHLISLLKYTAWMGYEQKLDIKQKIITGIVVKFMF